MITIKLLYFVGISKSLHFVSKFTDLRHSLQKKCLIQRQSVLKDEEVGYLRCLFLLHKLLTDCLWFSMLNINKSVLQDCWYQINWFRKKGYPKYLSSRADHHGIMNLCWRPCLMGVIGNYVMCNNVITHLSVCCRSIGVNCNWGWSPNFRCWTTP